MESRIAYPIRGPSQSTYTGDKTVPPEQVIIATPCAWVRRVPFRPFIYGLVDPLDPMHVRYVGMASVHPNRPFKHAQVARRANAMSSYQRSWVRNLQSHGREPAVLILEELPQHSSRQLLGLIERIYIDVLKRVGHRLTNMAEGGTGGNTGPISTDTRRKLSAAAKRHIKAHPRTPEYRAAVSATKKGIPGRKWTPEERARWSAKQKGVPKRRKWTLEARARLSAKLKGGRRTNKRTVLQRQKASAAQHRRYAKERAWCEAYTADQTLDYLEWERTYDEGKPSI